MPRRRGVTDPAAGQATRQGEIHPALSAACFSSLAQKTGGATLNVHTGEVAKPHTPGYIVGGEPDRTGRRVPTEYEDVSGNASLDRVLHHRSRIAAGTDAPHASMGYWRDPEAAGSPYEVDASAIFHDRSAAKQAGHRRGEKAVWDLQKMDDIRLDGKRQQASA